MIATPPTAAPEPPRGLTHPGGPVPGWDAAVEVQPPASPLHALLARKGRWSVSLAAHGFKTVRLTLSKRW